MFYLSDVCSYGKCLAATARKLVCQRLDRSTCRAPSTTLALDLAIQRALGSTDFLGAFLRRHAKQDHRANLLINGLLRRGEQKFELLPLVGGLPTFAFGLPHGLHLKRSAC